MKKKTILFLLSVLLVLLQLHAFPMTTEASGSKGALLIINKTTNKLGYFNEGELVKTFDVATGKTPSLTPEGTFMIVNKIKNRPYYKKNIKGGDPKNPLGDRWLGLNAKGTWGTTYAIHGNNNENSIGKYVSAGCIRMHNEEVRWLFDQVAIHTKVIIGQFKDSLEQVAEKNGYKLNKELSIELDGKKLNETPILKDGRVLVPVRGIFQQLGAKVEWDTPTKTVFATKDTISIKLPVGSKKAFINEKEVLLEVPAQIIKGSTYVPVRFVSEALGAKVHWNEKERIVSITSKVPEPPKPIKVEKPQKTFVNIQINDGEINPFPQKAFIENGTTMVPIRGIVEQFGGTITWVKEEAKIVIEKDETVIELKVGEKTAKLNNEEIQLTVPAIIEDGTTYVPARFISEAFGVQISWDDKQKLVTILFEKQNGEEVVEENGSRNMGTVPVILF